MNRETFPPQEYFDASLDMKKAVNLAAKAGQIAPHHIYTLVMTQSSDKESGFYFFEKIQSDEELREFGAVGKKYERFVEDGQIPHTKNGKPILINNRLAIHDPQDYDEIYHGLPVKYI